MVVDDDPFPVDSSTIERPNDLRIQRAQTAALIEAGAYNGELDHDCEPFCMIRKGLTLSDDDRWLQDGSRTPSSRNLHHGFGLLRPMAAAQCPTNLIGRRLAE